MDHGMDPSSGPFHRRTSPAAPGFVIMRAGTARHGAGGMGEPGPDDTTTTTQLCATLAGAHDARERQLALLGAVVAAAAGGIERSRDGDCLRVAFAAAP